MWTLAREKTNPMKAILKRAVRTLLDLFTDTTNTYWEWTWESDAERDAFRKYFRFCN